jgi:hypothetical protein
LSPYHLVRTAALDLFVKRRRFLIWRYAQFLGRQLIGRLGRERPRGGRQRGGSGDIGGAQLLGEVNQLIRGLQAQLIR